MKIEPQRRKGAKFNEDFLCIPSLPFFSSWFKTWKPGGSSQSASFQFFPIASWHIADCRLQIALLRG